jgi:hypothetical protein
LNERRETKTPIINLSIIPERHTKTPPLCCCPQDTILFLKTFYEAISAEEEGAGGAGTAPVAPDPVLQVGEDHKQPPSRILFDEMNEDEEEEEEMHRSAQAASNQPIFFRSVFTPYNQSYI